MKSNWINERIAEPETWVRFHVLGTLIWLVLIPPTMLFWAESILWVLLISIYANIVGHIGAYQASRAERSEAGGLDNEDLMDALELILARLDNIEQQLGN